MSDEAAEFLSELRESRIEHDHLMGEIRTELAGLRTDLDAGFRMMDAGFRRMNEQLAVLLETTEALQRRFADPSSRLPRRRKLG